MKISFCICLLLAFCASVHAQDAAQTPRPTPPPGPLLNRAPNFSSWMVVIKRPKPDDVTKGSGRTGGAPPPTAGGETKPTVEIRVTLTKTGPIRKEEEADGNGHTMVKWYTGAMQITMKSGWTTPVLSSAATNPFDSLLTDYSKTDFPGFEWISEQNFVGIKNVAGHNCLIFKDKASLVSADELRIRKEIALLSAGGNASTTLKIDPEQFQKEAVACIDVETRLPVALQRVDETRLYQFQTPPQEMLALPKELQAPLDVWNRERAAQARPAARPY